MSANPRASLKWRDSITEQIALPLKFAFFFFNISVGGRLDFLICVLIPPKKPLVLLKIKRQINVKHSLEPDERD